MLAVFILEANDTILEVASTRDQPPWNQESVLSSGGAVGEEAIDPSLHTRILSCPDSI
jgi:hypothetical protein